jgi:hypothetical protein
MNWLQQNRFLGIFLGALALVSALATHFLLHQKGAADDQQSRLDTTIAELTRLRQGRPFPNVENLAKSKAQTDSYRSSLLALEAELKARTLPVVPIQPNEFQTQLRQSITGVVENARASKVRLPENFYLGFDEYATSLPNSPATAALLGRELKAIEGLANMVVAAHVDSIDSLTRLPLAEEKPAPPNPPPAKGGAAKSPLAGNAPPTVVQGNPLEFSFSATPAATRKVLNGIATAREQLFVIRTLVVKNQVDKGAKRETAPEAATPSLVPTPQASRSGLKTAPPAAVTFIVGTEHLNVAARLDIENLNFRPEEVR